jgi:hypothetical protein
MPNLYVDVDAFRRRFVNNAVLDLSDEQEIVRVLETTARGIDEYTHRHYYALTQTRYFDGDGCGEMYIPDLLAVTTIKFDEDGDRVFELTLQAATDYYLLRPGADNEDALPRTLLRLDDVNGQRASFLARRRLIEIVGRWGYTEAVERIAPTITLADGSTSTATVSEIGDIADGQTLLVNGTAEQVYVVQKSGTTTLTVQRGMNGTTAAGATDAALDRFVYVPEIREANLIMASRLWKRRESGYAGINAGPAGVAEFIRHMDPDVAAMLAPFVRVDRSF